MRHLCVITTLAALLVAAAPASAPAAGWNESRTTWPTTDTIYNTCNGEVVLVNANYTEVVRIRSDAGRLRYEFYGWLSDVTAADTVSGRPYTVWKSETFRTDSRENEIRTTQTAVLRLRPTGKASGQTLWVTWVTHTRVDPTTGEVIGEPIDSYRTACR